MTMQTLQLGQTDVVAAVAHGAMAGAEYGAMAGAQHGAMAEHGVMAAEFGLIAKNISTETLRES